MSRVRIIETDLKFRRGHQMRPRTDFANLHHSGPIPPGMTAQDISADIIHRWHLARGRFWSGIGYHYVIMPDGGIERGRPRWAMGAHDEGENACSLGICMAGDYRYRLPTPHALDSLVHLLADLCDIYRWQPSAETIRGHRDNEPPETPTECPGEALYQALPEIRERATRIWGAV